MNKKKKVGIIGTVLAVGGAVVYGMYKVLTAERDIEKYSPEWFKFVSDEVLNDERELVRLKYVSPADYNDAVGLERLLRRFDDEIRKRTYGDTEPGYPVHREHGWYVSSDD